MKKHMIWLAAAVSGIGLPVALYLVFFVAPMQDELYLNQKIFYFHVPSAMMLFVAVFVCGIWSLLYLRKRNPAHDEIASAGAELAVMFGGIVLVTGSIWGKAAWNVWWQWDARLTSSLLLWLVMVGYSLVRTYAGPGSERLAAGLAVFAMVNVPLVYVSVNVWRTLHPTTNVVQKLEGGMRLAYWFSVLVFVALFLLLLGLRRGYGRLVGSLERVREQGIDAGLLDN